MVKEICNALVEADVNVKLVAGLRKSIMRTVNFKDLAPGVNKKRIIQKVYYSPTFFCMTCGFLCLCGKYVLIQQMS